MKLYYNNVEIYNDVSMNYCVYENHAEKRADSLAVRFNDVSGMWSGWNPEQGDQIRLKHEYADTGVMYVDSVSAENGIFTIRALSMPKCGLKTKKTRNWEQMSFIRIISQIASEAGLSYKCYGVSDQIYKYVAQENETDMEFLERLTSCESCAFMIYNKTIVVYSEPYMESREAQGTITVGENGMFDYKLDGLKYKSCSVVNGSVSGTFTGTGGDDTLSINLKAMTNGEAMRFAQGMLRKHNKEYLTGKFVKSLQTQYSAASVVNLETTKASIWNRKVFITRVRHDFLKNRSDIFFRGLLEGY